MNKGLKNCSENFHISVFMLRGKAKCKSRRGEGKQRRREGEPEMLYNGEAIEGQMGKCKDILFCYTEGFVMSLNVPGSFISTVRNDTNSFSQGQTPTSHTHNYSIVTYGTHRLNKRHT